jgi:hypothetical protein
LYGWIEEKKERRKVRATDGYGLAQVSGSGQGFNQSSQKRSDSVEYASGVQDTRHMLDIFTSVKAAGFSPIAFGNQTISIKALIKNPNTLARRLTALRPYLAIGLPLSYAIIALQKINVVLTRWRGHDDHLH